MAESSVGIRGERAVGCRAPSRGGSVVHGGTPYPECLEGHHDAAHAMGYRQRSGSRAVASRSASRLLSKISVTC